MGKNQLFNKAAVFGDLHLGDKSDSPVHNQDCINYIEWFCAKCKDEEVDLIIFVGDWFDNRSRLRLDTIDAGNKALRMLLEVAPVYMIVGNHDMFFRNNRSVHSIDAYKEWDGVTIIDTPTVIDGVGLAPYLVGTEYLEVLDMECKYLFGHFELPHFLMNSTIEMPDKGTLKYDAFTHPEMVFTGHFHKRQLKTNKNGVSVWYIGSPFGHDFNDVDDELRGMMVIEWDQQPRFLNWADGPLYQRFNTEEIIEIIENDTLTEVTRPTSILEVRDNIGLELEDISLVRQELTPHIRELRVIQAANNPGVDQEAQVDEIDGKDIKTVVIEHLLEIDPRGSDIDPEQLVKLFEGS